MTAPFGYHGHYLDIDVGRQSFERCPISTEALRSYLGGVGLGAFLLNEVQGGGVDPFSPESAVAFVFSPLVGSPLTTSAKFAVVGKSPLTNRINDSLASSGFAIAGKRTGVDAIVIRGQAASPTLISVLDSGVQFHSAEAYWGLECADAEDQIRRDHAIPNSQIAVIGPAGERQVRFATISHDGRHAGRGGHGAILGSKKVKAILVAGDQRVSWAAPDELYRLSKELSKKSFGPATAKYRELGTAANLLVFNRLSMLPTRNFRDGQLDDPTPLAPETMQQDREKTRKSCAACTIGCEHLYGGSDGQAPVRVEYESLFALGANCGINDADAVLEACRRCDALGLDTISTGGTIAFALDCAEAGLLDDVSASTAALKFGKGTDLLELIELIGRREAFGDRLAEGSRMLAQSLGPAAEKLLNQIKGLELPGYEPRGLTAMSIGLAVGTRGADHNRSGAYEADFSGDVTRGDYGVDTIQKVIESEDRAAIMDSMILCKFVRGVFTDFYAESAEMLRAVTGWDITADELKDAAQKIVEEKQKFNALAGWTPTEDTLPPRMFSQAVGPHPAIDEAAFRRGVQLYHQQRGWVAEK
jgi:aldehyde:ferredoxin oxidoreductase